MHYYEERKKKGSGKIIAVVIIAVVIIVVGLAVFFNFDKLKYYFQNGEMPDPEATVTAEPEITAVPTATPEPVPPINPAGETIGTRFNPPAGYVRASVPEGSFGEYIRNFRLKSYGTVAKLADGSDNPNAPTDAVLDMDIRKNGLQQCADSIIRLYAEYRYARGEYEYITFDLYTTPVFVLDFSTWTQGNRIKANGNKIEWYKSDDATPGDTSYSTLRYYLDNVFLYANTYSLKNQMMSIDSNDIQVGDCLIITAAQTGGADGHALLVVDVAVNTETGKKIFMIAEGNTPATEMYVVKDRANDTVWFSLNEDGTFTKISADGREVNYPLDAFRRFKR
ncbi:MAG: hypothetical protein J5950_03760 [Clostridia bacterium]|nr:hypothetical protein [Clostridia bacterium]